MSRLENVRIPTLEEGEILLTWGPPELLEGAPPHALLTARAKDNDLGPEALLDLARWAERAAETVQGLRRAQTEMVGYQVEIGNGGAGWLPLGDRLPGMGAAVELMQACAKVWQPGPLRIVAYTRTILEELPTVVPLEVPPAPLLPEVEAAGSDWLTPEQRAQQAEARADEQRRLCLEGNAYLQECGKTLEDMLEVLKASDEALAEERRRRRELFVDLRTIAGPGPDPDYEPAGTNGNAREWLRWIALLLERMGGT